MEITNLIIYTGAFLVFVSVIMATSVQLKHAKESGVYSSLLNELDTKDKKKLKAALVVFILGLLILASGIAI